MEEKWAWKGYQLYDYIKSGLNYRWNYTVDKIGKQNLKHEFSYKTLAGRAVLTVEETYQLIADSIKRQCPFMAGRFGRTEQNLIVHTLNRRYGKAETKEESALKALCVYSGFFPEDIQLGRKFVDLMLNDLSSMDLHAIWPLYMEEYLIHTYEDKRVQLTKLGYLEPFHIPRNSKIKPWSHALVGKKVLVIHPFAETIMQQYANNREKIFKKVYEAEDILPEFDLHVIKAVQTLAENKDNRFSTWFEALKWMEDECTKIDFDVALIGCGAYGLPLAATVKRMGKIAIHMGGGLQLLFGICGARWENGGYDWYNNIVNDSWVRPNSKEVIKNYEKIEEGCYW